MAMTKSERQDILLTLIDRLEDTIEDLKEIGHYDDAECVQDILRDLNGEVVEISDELWQEDERDMRDQIHDYYKSVM